MKDDGHFTTLATPTDADAAHNHPHTTTPSSSSSPSPASDKLVWLLRGAILLCMAGYVFGNVATWAPLYELQLVDTFSRWWGGYPNQHHTATHNGVAHNILDTGVGRNITITGHTEMIRPTFLLLFCIAPFFASVLLLEWLRHVAPTATSRSLSIAATRIASRYLRGKPHFRGRVSRLTLGEWLFGVVFVIGGNLLCFYYEWDRRIAMAQAAVAAGTGQLNTTKYFNIIGISSAYLCIYNMAFLLLPVTRGSAWSEFFNVSYANSVKLHRWVGYATVVTAVVHTGGYWGKWLRDGTFTKNQTPCIHCDLGDDATGYYAWFNFFGLLSVVSLLLIIPTSLPRVRRTLFEYFYVSHYVLFIIALVFAILHWAQILWWLLPSAMLFLTSRAVSSWNGLAPVLVTRFDVVTSSGVRPTEAANDKDEALVRLVVQRAVVHDSPAASNADYRVGQFVYINVPHLSTLQWHALTIASSPLTSRCDLTLLIKPLGEWSRQLVAYAHDCQSTKTLPVVYVDGFYGASLASYDTYATLCLVGGGIGVTPLLAVLEDVAARVAARDGRWTQRVVLVLTMRELALLHVVAPVLTTLRQLDPLAQHFVAHVYLTHTPRDAALNAAIATSVQVHSHTYKDPRGAPAVVQRPSTTTAAVRWTAPRAFYVPLQSSVALRVALFVALFVGTSVALAAARWGNGAIQGDHHPQLWPLERAFELAVLCSSIALAYIAIWLEWMTFQRSHSACENSSSSNSDDGACVIANAPRGSALIDAFSRDVHSVRELLHELQVVVGERPDMLTLLRATVAAQEKEMDDVDDTSVVGVIVSGPESLKIATNDAIIALGAAKFDVHEEEFEL